MIDLIEAARCQDHAAWHEIVRRHDGRLRKVARCFRGIDADNVVQDVLAKAYERGLSGFRAGNLGAWLDRCVRNRCIDAQRSNAALATFYEDLSAGPGPEEAAIVVDEAQRALATLEPTDRHLVRMVAAGFSHEEAGAVLGVSRGAVGVRLHRLRRRVARR